MLEKVITLESCRNQISFNSFDDINHDIINNHLAILIASLKIIIPINLIEDGKTNFDIRRNHINYSIRIKTKQDMITFLILRSFMDTSGCKYIEVNSHVYKNGLYKDILSLEYNPLSFRQPDDSIREYMISYFQKSFLQIHYQFDKEYDVIDNVILFGGECVLLGKILSGYSRRQIFYTDFQSIYDDILRNYKSPFANLIDYKTWECPNYYSFDNHANNVCIVNTGFQGMGINLAKQLVLFKTNIIFVISCNEDSWNEDFLVLKNSYRINEKIEIRTNYSVWIYKLQLLDTILTTCTLESKDLDDSIARLLE
jgi:hypothetical protein